MKTTKYEQFIDEMERNGFRKVHSVIDEIYARLSDEDDIISITAHDCHMMTIKGMKESKREDGSTTPVHKLFMKIYGEGGKELEHNDTIQFSIAESIHKGLPTMDKDIYRCIYYQYPYRSLPLGIKFKKGIAITKDKRLDIKIFRDSKPVKVGKFVLELECDKWLK